MTIRVEPRRVRLGALASLLWCGTVTACGTEPVEPTLPASIRVASGNDQTAFAGTALDDPISVKVTNERGNAVAGVPVAFTVTAGGGSVAEGPHTTDAAGVATLQRWTLGPDAGTNSLAASVVGSSALTAQVSATGTPRVLVVRTTADVVNGDVGSPSSLVASPGADGVSLREAIVAANASSLPFEITFGAELAGHTIALTQPLPDIRRDSTRLTGLRVAGVPQVTLDAAAITACCSYAALGIQASWVTVTGIRVINVRHRNRGISILAGPPGGTTGRPAGPSQIRHVRIAHSVFDNGTSTEDADAIILGPENGTAQGTTIQGVTVDSNTFIHFQGDAVTVHVQAGGIGGVIRDVQIAANIFEDCTLCVELTAYHSDNVIRNTRILRNAFVRSQGFSISLNISRHEGTGTRNTIDSTLVAGNTFTDGKELEFDATPFGGASDNVISATSFVGNTITGSGRGISFTAGRTAGTTGNRLTGTVVQGNRFSRIGRFPLEIYAGNLGASNNVAAGVQITNNVFDRNLNSLLLIAGSGGTGNRLEDVAIVNNTFYEMPQSVTLLTNENATGNVVAGFAIMNSIFWYPGRTSNNDFFGDIPAGAVTYSIVQQASYAGPTNKVNADPVFLDAAAGDFRLGAGSPAIGSGNATGAPAIDIWCRPRTGAMDMGAFAFGTGSNQCAAGATVQLQLPAAGAPQQY